MRGVSTKDQGRCLDHSRQVSGRSTTGVVLASVTEHAIRSPAFRVAGITTRRRCSAIELFPVAVGAGLLILLGWHRMHRWVFESRRVVALFRSGSRIPIIIVSRIVVLRAVFLLTIALRVPIIAILAGRLPPTAPVAKRQDPNGTKTDETINLHDQSLAHQPTAVIIQRWEGSRMAEVTRKEIVLALVSAGDRPRLRHLDLSNLDMSGLSLSHADLTSANLNGANLAGALLDSAILKNANLNGANLNGAQLSNAELQGASLVSAHLVAADLSRANFSEADLTGANLTDAITTGTNFSKTTGKT